MTSRPARLSKTAKAWTLLAQRDPIERSVHALLLLANGQRSEQELSMLLGTDVTDLVRDLRMQGCLQPAAQDQVDDGWEDAHPSPPVFTSIAPAHRPHSQRLSRPITRSNLAP